MPFRISGGKAYGPGTFDMKAGIVQALFAAEALQRLPASDQPRKRIVFLWTSDEEIGSESSRKLIETEARRSDAVFVLEPSFGPRGALKTAAQRRRRSRTHRSRTRLSRRPRPAGRHQRHPRNLAPDRAPRNLERSAPRRHDQRRHHRRRLAHQRHPRSRPRSARSPRNHRRRHAPTRTPPARAKA